MLAHSFPCWRTRYRRVTAMARASAGLPAGIRLSDRISLGVIARTFPPDQVRRGLAETGRAGEGERDLPAQVMVYYAIALALYMGSGTREVLRCLLEGVRWLWGAEAVRIAGKSGIFAGPRAPGRGPAAPVVRAGGAARGDARHQGRLVPAVAPGQPGRVLPRRGRHGRQPRRVRASGSLPRRERLPASPFRGAGRERHACAVQYPPRRLCRGRDDAGP